MIMIKVDINISAFAKVLYQPTSLSRKNILAFLECSSSLKAKYRTMFWGFVCVGCLKQAQEKDEYFKRTKCKFAGYVTIETDYICM